MSFGTVLSSLLAIVLSLAFVMALAWGVLWLLKRFQDGSFGRLSGNETGPNLRFERALPVGPRERLVLVEVDGEQILLGVTAHSITPLKTWPIDPAEADGDDTAEPRETADSKITDMSRKFRLRMAKGSQSEDGKE